MFILDFKSNQSNSLASLHHNHGMLVVGHTAVAFT